MLVEIREQEKNNLPNEIVKNIIQNTHNSTRNYFVATQTIWIFVDREGG